MMSVKGKTFQALVAARLAEQVALASGRPDIAAVIAVAIVHLKDANRLADDDGPLPPASEAA